MGSSDRPRHLSPFPNSVRVHKESRFCLRGIRAPLAHRCTMRLSLPYLRVVLGMIYIPFRSPGQLDHVDRFGAPGGAPDSKFYSLPLLQNLAFLAQDSAPMDESIFVFLPVYEPIPPALVEPLYSTDEPFACNLRR